jgi:hypothetical protein
MTGIIGEKSGFHDFFGGEGFLPADKNAFPVLINYQGGTSAAEMSAVLITAWSFYYKGLYKVMDDFLAVVYFSDNMPVYFTLHRPSPGGPPGDLRRMVNTLYDLSRRAGLPFLQIRRIEERFLKEFETLGGYAVKTEYREDDSEYAYRTADFLDLKGTINLKKRQRLTKLLKQENISFRPITKKDVALCLELEDAWCQGRDCEFCASFMGCERKALEVVVDIFDERYYKGIFLCQDGVPTGFGIGEIMNPGTGMAYFAKSPIQNHFLYILYMMAKMLFIDLEYINLDSDVGNPGIRLFKRHLGAYELWRKYICTFTGQEG